MIRVLFIVSLLSGVFSLNAQERGVVVSKVTATWCPNCGTWGWDYFEALRSQYTEEPNTCLIGVHYSGDLKNPVAEWFADNLGNSYQPEFYVNNEQVDVLAFNWNSKIQELRDKVDSYHQPGTFVDFDFVNAYVQSGEIICNVNFGASNKAAGDYYFAVYIFENNVENFQSSRGMEMHPNVLRDVIGDSFQGQLFVSSGHSSSGGVNEFRYQLDSSWDIDNLGLLAVLWEESSGKFIVENTRAIYNIGFLSSVQSINRDLFSLRYAPNGVYIDCPDYYTDLNFSVYDALGNMIKTGPLTTKQFLDSSQLNSGVYTLVVYDKDSFNSQQFIIAK